MGKAIYTYATEEEMAAFEANLNIWCKHHPKDCYLGCDNISQCSQPRGTLCNILDNNCSEGTYKKLAEQLDLQTEGISGPSAKTIKDYVSKWRDPSIRQKVKKTEPVQKLLFYLDAFKNNPYKDDTQLAGFLAQLKEFYNKFHLTKGCKLSKEVIRKYPFQVDVIRYWALFRNRKMLWTEVRKELNKKLNEIDDDKVKAECYLAIFESYLNEWTKDRHISLKFQTLLKAKEDYLDMVPEKETNGRYQYFLARYLEVEWWILPTEEAKLSSLLLRSGIIAINQSIKLYNEAASGYQASYKVPWWLHGHKAILCKLWRHTEYPDILNDYGQMILNEVFQADSILKKSVQMYAVTFFLLNDAPDELINFLIELETKKSAITSTEEAENLGSEEENFTYYHTDLIFYNNGKKRNKYYAILTEWFQRNTP